MDVNQAELGKGRLSEAKQKKLQVEGRCFFCYDFSLYFAYYTMHDSYRTFGLLTPLCLPSLRYFLMPVAVSVQILTQL